MLESVDVGSQSIEPYAQSTSAECIEKLRGLATGLRGLSVLHLSATPYGGGVAEILRSEIPLLRDLGLDADWKIISADQAFFKITKKIHNALQGAPAELTSEEWETYLAHSSRNANLLEEEYDIVVVHDPQPLALLELHGNGTARWLWRCHIDTSEPCPAVWEQLRPYVARYDGVVFTLAQFVPPDLGGIDVHTIPPAIDPESPKNIEIGETAARRILSWIGLELDPPLIGQVSRFDPWKDPLGVIAVHRLVKEEVPNLQLALIGSMALDDPEAWDVYSTIQSEARSDPSIHVFTNLTGVGNIEVNAFQRLADVVIQKSIREGFGLVVSETLWKRTPVVGGRAGGIPLQLDNDGGGFLVDSTEEAAARTLELLNDPALRNELGRHGRERVRERFLLTRLLEDELRLYASVLEAGRRAAAPAG